jgi:hypothetical protein
MADMNQEARIPVYINDEQAKQALKNLTSEAEKWRKKMFEAMTGGDLKAMKQAEKELKAINGQMNSIKKEAFDVNKVLANIANASTKDLRRAMQAVNKEMEGLNRNSKEYQALMGKKNAIKDEFSKINGSIKTQGSLLDNIKGMLPMMGWAAMAGAAVAAFNKIVNITDTLGTQWEATKNGMNEGLNEFWRTIATGDWSNFTDRMRDAIAMGEKYIYTLDDIEEQTRALSIIEAESRAKELELEEKLRNKTLNKEERIKAGEDRKALEKELAEYRTKVAQQTFDNEADLTAQQTKLSKEQLMAVVGDMDSATKIRAKAYNDQLDQYEKLKRANKMYVGGSNVSGGTLIALEDTPEMIRLKANMSATKEADKIYADQLRATGRTTDEQLDKMVASYVKLMEAQNSAKENTKRVTTQVNSLLAGEEENGTKIANKKEKEQKEAADRALEALDAANNERNAKLTKQYTDEGMSDAEFKNEMLAAEQAYLEMKRALLEQYGQNTVDVDRQINQKRIESQKEVNDAIIQAEKELDKENEEGVDPAVAAQIDATNAVLDNLRKSKDEEQRLLEERQRNYLDFAMNIGQIYGELMADNKSTTADYFKATFLMALEAFHQFFILERAKAIIAGAGGGLLGIGIAIAKVAAMEVAYQAVKGALSKKSYSDGGYTGAGGVYEPAGVVHKGEYVVSQDMMRNPNVRNSVNYMEIARRNRSFARTDMRQTIGLQGYSGGGYAGGNSQVIPNSFRDPNAGGLSQSISNAEISRLNSLLETMRDWNPELILSEFERKRDNWKKTTTGGLK